MVTQTESLTLPSSWVPSKLFEILGFLGLGVLVKGYKGCGTLKAVYSVLVVSCCLDAGTGARDCCYALRNAWCWCLCLLSCFKELVLGQVCVC